jgi:hypothetical protein
MSKEELKFLAPYIIGFFTALIISGGVMYYTLSAVKHKTVKTCPERDQLIEKRGLNIRPYRPQK